MMFSRFRRLIHLKNLLLAFALTTPLVSQATIVEMQTNMGNIDIQLFDNLAPKTVENFLSYVNSGAYNNSFFHRSIPGFIIQGGGYTWTAASGASMITQGAAVVNEFAESNLPGTIAMAKLGSSPNSATDEWFFNLVDNSSNLDNQNGGFTVFGQVIGNGMSVVNAIAALTVVDACSASYPSCPFTNLPYNTTSNLLAMVNQVVVLKTQILADEVYVPLTTATTNFTPPSTGVLNGVSVTNTQANAVTVTLVKNSSTVLVVTVQANSTLTIPLPSGLAFTSSDILHVDLPTSTSYADSPLYLRFDTR